MQQIKENFLESSSCFLLGYILSRFYTLMKKERRRYETRKKKEDKRKILHDLDHQLCNKKRYPSDHIRKMHLENGCDDAAVGPVKGVVAKQTETGMKVPAKITEIPSPGATTTPIFRTGGAASSRRASPGSRTRRPS
jgi:hypothetical protein